MTYRYHFHRPAQAEAAHPRRELRRDPALFETTSCILIALRRLAVAGVRPDARGGLRVEVAARWPRESVESALQRIARRWGWTLEREGAPLPLLREVALHA